MKMILSILLLLLSIGSTFGQDSENIREIRFETFSRGFQKSIVIKPDSTIIREQGMKTGEEEVKRKTRDAEWNQLMQAIPDYPLAQLDKLEAPGMDRASDRARHSRITIKTSKDEYRSAEFDNETPHKKLMPLMEAIKNMEERKN
jgi:hypothetical protein